MSFGSGKSKRRRRLKRPIRGEGKKKIKTYAAELNAKKLHNEQNFKTGTAIIVGTEATGLSNEWMNAAEEKIKIPMLGKIDSLNVSVSAGILLFEAVRQRMNE